MFIVTGRMKNFLDHVAYTCHRPKYFRKKAFLLSTCTKWQKKGVFIPMETWSSGAGFTVSEKLFVEMYPFPLLQKKLDKIRIKIAAAAGRFHESFGTSVELKPDFGSVTVFHIFRALAGIAPRIFRPITYISTRRMYVQGRGLTL